MKENQTSRPSVFQAPKLKSWWSEQKRTFPQRVAKWKTRFSQFLLFVSNIELDALFFFLATYILLPEIGIWYRILGSLGITYFWKVIVEDIIRIKTLRSRR